MLDYFPGNTLIHRLDVRTKVIIFSIITLLLFMFKTPVFNLGLAVIGTYFMLYIKIPYDRLWKRLKPVFPILIMIVIFSGFTYPASSFDGELANQILFYAWPNEQIPFSYGGLFFGITLLFRIYTMVIMTSVLTFTTPVEDFVQLMRKMKLPQPLTFMIVTAIRFVPTMQRKVDQVFAAQRARGAKLSGNGMFGQLFSYLSIMVPLIVDSLRMSENLAIAMLNRGYGASREWTALKVLKMGRLDYLMIGLSIICLSGFMVIRLLGYGDI